MGQAGESRRRRAEQRELGRRLAKAEGGEAANLFAAVALSIRPALFSAYADRVRTPDDLDDCFARALTELCLPLQEGRRHFESFEHAVNALEQRFDSRLRDLWRAQTRRQRYLPQIELEGDAVEAIRSMRGLPEEEAERDEVHGLLADVTAELTEDERRFVVCRSRDMTRTEICRALGWGTERYKSIARRAMAKLRVLIDDAESGERCRRLEPQVAAYVAGAADGAEANRAKLHLLACTGCRHTAGELRAAIHGVGALLPVPVALTLTRPAAGWELLTHAAATLRMRIGGILGRGPRSDAVEAVAGTGAASGGAVALKAVGVCGALAVGTSGVCLGPRLLDHHSAPAHHAQAQGHLTQPRHAPHQRVAVASSAPSLTPVAEATRHAAAVQAATPTPPSRPSRTSAPAHSKSATPAASTTTTTVASSAPPAATEFGVEGRGGASETPSATSTPTASTASVAPSSGASSSTPPPAPSDGGSSATARQAAAEFAP